MKIWDSVYICIKRPRLAIVRFLNGREEQTTMNHPNTKLVRYSSPHCTLVEFLTTHIMTSHLSVLAPRKDSKNPELYYYPTTRHIWIN